MSPPAAPGPSPWERWGWALAVIWLVFLVFPVSEALQRDASPLLTGATLLALVAFAILYVLGYTVWESHPLSVFAGLAVLAAATIPLIGLDFLGLVPFLGAYAALQLPEPWWRWLTPATALLPLLSFLGEGFPLFFFLIVWPIIAVCVMVRVFVGLDSQSEETRSTLALVAERERVARDVHDVLGHTLTVLSVKAELAGRLIDVDPDRARAELESIQETARQALAEVRATVGGLRAANLDSEVAAAPQVLADAGIGTTMEGSVADTDPRHRALLAWVLRESVTNVIRHAGATQVLIHLDANGLTVTDDGAGVAMPEGNGLRGMRERVRAAGGTLAVVSADPGTTVEVVLA